MARPRVSISRNKIIQLYIVENKSGLETARILGVGRSTLSRYLDKFGLERKTMSEVMTQYQLAKTPLCLKTR